MDISGEKWGISYVLSKPAVHDNSLEYHACLLNFYRIPTRRELLSTMFIGEYQHSLDEKGRLAIPKKFRQALQKGAVVTRGLDNCLFLYTRAEWTKLAEKLANLPFAQANTRAFARLMLAGAMDVSIDKQGRIMVPEYLRSFADLTKGVTVAGLYNRLELWNVDEWDKYKTRTEKESTKIAEQMAELGV